MQKGRMVMKAEKKSRRFKTAVLIMALCIAAGSMFAMTGCGSDEEAAPEGEKAPAYVNPLTGEGMDSEIEAARPLVVSIDNVGDAIPQSWLSMADMVYEFPVEGRQTRLQAVYYSEFPEEFGPLRSVRPYFVDLVREYDAIYLAHGWSPDAKSYLLSGVVPYINGMNSELDFYRSPEKSAPHDSYLKWSEVKSKIDQQGWWSESVEVDPFEFLGSGEIVPGERALKVNFAYSSSKCEFTYDGATNTYKRTINGKEYIDLETGEQIETSNILVQKVSSSVMDGKGRLKINMCSGGEAMLFTGGKMVKGSWSRADLDSRTVFVDEAGNEFRLSAGTTWVEVADQSCSITYDNAGLSEEVIKVLDAAEATALKLVELNITAE